MNEILKATWETIEMTIIPLIISYIIALPIGILTDETSKNGLFPCRIANMILNVIIGAGRAIPFTILMVLALPLTRALVGTGIGTTATIVPLTISAIPFVARTIEQSLDQVTNDIVEASKMDGASMFRIIFEIKIGQRMFDIVNSFGFTSVAIISYTCMAGVVGGGGLGNYALTYGYYRYDWSAVLWATLVIIIIVCVFQWIPRLLSKKFEWRSRRVRS